MFPQYICNFNMWKKYYEMLFNFFGDNVLVFYFG